jgi:hypothetical protein
MCRVDSTSPDIARPEGPISIPRRDSPAPRPA